MQFVTYTKMLSLTSQKTNFVYSAKLQAFDALARIRRCVLSKLILDDVATLAIEQFTKYIDHASHFKCE
jgi:hypothetical protein